MSKVRTIVFCSKYYQNNFLILSKGSTKGGARQQQFGFAFDFLQFASVKSLKIWEVCPPDHLQAEKNRSYKGSFLAIFNFLFSFSISNLFSINRD